MFDWLYKLLGLMLSFFSSITGSYAIALLFYALIFKILFLPFSIKQQKNQIKMAKLTPKIELIRAKYKGRTDQRTMQKQQQEIMELQQKEGYSPFSGCLPLLIQLPLIMLLYAVIQNPLSYIAKTNQLVEDYNDSLSSSEVVNADKLIGEYEELVKDKKEIDMDDIILRIYNELPQVAGESDEEYNSRHEASSLPKNSEIKLINKIYAFVDNTEDNSVLPNRDARIAYVESFGIDFKSIPNFNIFGVNLAETPSLKNFSVLVLIPVLAALSSWLSMWLTRKMNSTGLSQPQDAQTKASMRIMDLIMPLITLWIAFSFSGMLGLYWILQSMLGLIQSFILSRAMPLPKYTEEELKEMRRAQKEAEKAQRAASKAQPKHKSLHYIDDDDYDELPEIKTSSDDNKKPTSSSSDIPELKD